MKLTDIVLAVALATLALLTTLAKAETPWEFEIEGLQKMSPDTTCETWYLYFTLQTPQSFYRPGYFEVDGCMDGTVTVGDNTYTLVLDTATNITTFTEDSTGLSVSGAMGWKDKGLDDSGTRSICYVARGVGPHAVYPKSGPVCAPHCGLDCPH